MKGPRKGCPVHIGDRINLGWTYEPCGKPAKYEVVTGGYQSHPYVVCKEHAREALADGCDVPELDEEEVES